MSKNIKTTISLIIIILLLGGGYYYANKTVKSLPDGVVDISTIQGCYAARINKDTYALNIDSEKNGVISGVLAYTNYQKDSSSGIFEGTYEDGVLLGDYSFEAEGTHSNRQVIFKKVEGNFMQGFGPSKIINGKEVFISLENITYDPKFTFIKKENCIEHFVGSPETVSFNYNSFFAAVEGSKSYALDWRQGSKQKGVLLASVSVPSAYFPNTNFSGARLTIGRSSDPNEIKNCTTSETGLETKVEEGEISGFPFSKFSIAEGAAGNSYDTTSYKGIVDGDCYVVEYTIHSTNIGSYSPGQGIKEFDKSKIQDELEGIIKSITFLVNSD